MSRQELRYRGPLDVGDGTVRHVEVWTADQTAVAFEDSTQVAVMQGTTVGATSDRRIEFDGTVDGAPAVWVGPDPERVVIQFGGASINWPDGTPWRAVTISQSQYGVLAQIVGQEPRFLPGARVEMVGPQRWIVDGQTRILADAGRRGCGCGSS